MGRLFAVLVCVVGLAQWKADRQVFQCDGSPTDVVTILLERKMIQAFPISCETCCDESCATLCGSTCWEYVHGPWIEIDRVDQPTSGPDVCFDWDSSPAGTPGNFFPLLNETWWFRTATIDVAGNVGRLDCP